MGFTKDYEQESDAENKNQARTVSNTSQLSSKKEFYTFLQELNMRIEIGME